MNITNRRRYENALKLGENVFRALDHAPMLGDIARLARRVQLTVHPGRLTLDEATQLLHILTAIANRIDAEQQAETVLAPVIALRPETS